MMLGVIEILSNIKLGLEIANKLKDLLPTSKPDGKFIQIGIESHINFINNWSSSVNEVSYHTSRQLDTHFVSVSLSLTPKKYQRGKLTDGSRVEAFSYIADSNHSFIILGMPGSGKTTLMKFLCRHYILNQPISEKDSYNLPLVYVCRQNLDIDILDWLISNFGGPGLFYDYIDDTERTPPSLVSRSLKVKVAAMLLDTLNSTFIIDGIDEIPAHQVSALLNIIEELGLHLEVARIIVTSRAGGFNSKPQGFEVCELASLDTAQQHSFAKLYLADASKSSQMLDETSERNLSDLASRPLTLSYLCRVFEDYHEIPDTRRSLLEKIIEILIIEWDQKRRIERVSKYGNFVPKRKQEFLAHFAFRAARRGHRGYLPFGVMSSIYGEICEGFDLPQGDAKQVFDEIESHNGLLLAGADGGYEFAHLTLQEFLAGSYLSRTPNLLLHAEAVCRLPAEFAVATGLSMEASQFMCRVIPWMFRASRLDCAELVIYLGRISLEKPMFTVDHDLGCYLIFLGSDQALGVQNESVLASLIEDNSSLQRSISIAARHFDVLPSSADAQQAYHLHVPKSNIVRTYLNLNEISIHHKSCIAHFLSI